MGPYEGFIDAIKGGLDNIFEVYVATLLFYKSYSACFFTLSLKSSFENENFVSNFIESF